MAAGADAYRADDTRMTWAVHDVNMGTVWWCAALGALVLAFMLLFPNRTVLRLHPSTRTIGVSTRSLLVRGSGYDRSVDDVERATVETIEDSEFKSLCLVEQDEPLHLATGDDTSCSKAAATINAFLRETRRAKKDGHADADKDDKS